MKKGFTLIELLAVIVILAIIALIASPIIIGLIEDARKEAFKNTTYGIIESGELLFSKDLLNGTTEEAIFTYNNGVETSTISGKTLEYSGSKPKSGSVVINSEGQVAIAIHNGKYCTEKGYEESEVTLSDKIETECIIVPLPGSGICGDNFYDSRDTNTYKTVQMGTQCWMAEDLRYDCSLVGYTNVGAVNSWTGTNNCGNQGTGYTGLLYQWPVAMNGSTTEGAQGLCPSGWHIATDTEWKELEMFLGMNSTDANATGWRGTDQGNQLKSVNPNWCNSQTNCATSGFNALPTGNRAVDGSLYNVDGGNSWWASSVSGSNAWSRGLIFPYSDFYRYSNSKTNGFSVRCILG